MCTPCCCCYCNSDYDSDCNYDSDCDCDADSNCDCDGYYSRALSICRKETERSTYARLPK
jgi:hypothetical protein